MHSIPKDWHRIAVYSAKRQTGCQRQVYCGSLRVTRSEQASGDVLRKSEVQGRVERLALAFKVRIPLNSLWHDRDQYAYTHVRFNDWCGVTGARCVRLALLLSYNYSHTLCFRVNLCRYSHLCRKAVEETLKLARSRQRDRCLDTSCDRHLIFRGSHLTTWPHLLSCHRKLAHLSSTSADCYNLHPSWMITTQQHARALRRFRASPPHRQLGLQDQV